MAGGKASRRKGDTFEREVAKALTAAGLGPVRRQESSGASHPTRRDLDPSASPFWRLFHFSLKRRAGLLVESWMREAEVNAAEEECPLVVARADRADPVVIMRLDEFVDMCRDLCLAADVIAETYVRDEEEGEDAA